jgi:hypothetical protein
MPNVKTLLMVTRCTRLLETATRFRAETKPELQGRTVPLTNTLFATFSNHAQL